VNQTWPAYSMRLSENTTWAKRLLPLLAMALGALVSCHRSGPDRVVIRTEVGEIFLEIYSDKAPLTASNFLFLVDRGVYTNACFYRVVRPENQPLSPVKIEVIQGGLFEDELVNAHSPVAHETTEASGIRHTDGVISMARNEPGTASTEFFICIGDQPSLDFGGDRNPDGQGFAAFGRITAGMDVVRKIQSLPDSGQYLADRVLILGMERLKD
jgi:peptidyl-prolyl cis-trans isomerase A (cyclophilin A)